LGTVHSKKTMSDGVERATPNTGRDCLADDLARSANHFAGRASRKGKKKDTAGVRSIPNKRGNSRG
jgi:hypothetical protein